MDIVISLVLLYGGPIFGVAIGIAYFVNAGTSASLKQRLLTSAFGPSLFFLFLSSFALGSERFQYSSVGLNAYLLLQVLPALLLALCLATYPGPKKMHWLLIPGVFAWALLFATGWLAIHGE